MLNINNNLFQNMTKVEEFIGRTLALNPVRIKTRLNKIYIYIYI